MHPSQAAQRSWRIFCIVLKNNTVTVVAACMLPVSVDQTRSPTFTVLTPCRINSAFHIAMLPFSSNQVDDENNSAVALHLPLTPNESPEPETLPLSSKCLSSAAQVR